MWQKYKGFKEVQEGNKSVALLFWRGNFNDNIFEKIFDREF